MIAARHDDVGVDHDHAAPPHRLLDELIGQWLQRGDGRGKVVIVALAQRGQVLVDR